MPVQQKHLGLFAKKFFSKPELYCDKQSNDGYFSAFFNRHHKQDVWVKKMQLNLC